jgi:hypothetical protein
MALLASVLVGVAGKASPLVQQGRSGMTAILEQRQGSMRGRQFIVTAAAIVCGVTGSALHAIDPSIFTMQVVAPPRRVGHRAHGSVASRTF